MITYETYFIDEPINVYYKDTLLGTIPKQVNKTAHNISLVIDGLALENLRNTYRIPTKYHHYFNGTDVVFAKKKPSLKGTQLSIPYYLEGTCNQTPLRLSGEHRLPLQQVEDSNRLVYTLEQLTPVIKPTRDFPDIHINRCAYLQKGLYLTIDNITCPSVDISQKPYKLPSALGHNFRPSVLTPKA